MSQTMRQTHLLQQRISLHNGHGLDETWRWAQGETELMIGLSTV